MCRVYGITLNFLLRPQASWIEKMCQNCNHKVQKLKKIFTQAYTKKTYTNGIPLFTWNRRKIGSYIINASYFQTIIKDGLYSLIVMNLIVSNLIVYQV